MYVPPHFEASETDVRELLDHHGAADLVAITSQGLFASFIPFIYDPDLGSLLGHVARGNDQWRLPVLSDALVIIHGPQAYVSPSWYPSNTEHGRVVPTWNYLVAHVYGRLIVHDDAEWVEDLVRRLTEKHEAERVRPWSIDDAPPSFIAAQLRGIVGIEIAISRVEAKAKWSQNRSAGDSAGVIEGLESDGQLGASSAMRSIRFPKS